MDPWTVAHQAPLSMEFSSEEYWSGLPFPSPVDRPYPGIKPGSPALQADSTLLTTWEAPTKNKIKKTQMSKISYVILCNISVYKYNISIYIYMIFGTLNLVHICKYI